MPLGSQVETGIRARLSDLDDLVEASMTEWKVPGLAFAVIRGDETEGYSSVGAHRRTATLRGCGMYPRIERGSRPGF
jgi:hypothetical protein